MALEERLENWGDCLRWRKRQRQASSFEGGYRSPQGRHWEWLQTAPKAPVSLNAADAMVVNRAWQAMPDAYHSALLGAWYVNRWAERHCVIVAREAAGEERTRRPIGDFEASIAMARALIAEQLALPAVILRARIVARVHQALGLDDLLAPTKGLDTPIACAAA